MAARDQKEKKKKAAWRQKIKEKQEAAERAANR